MSAELIACSFCCAIFGLLVGFFVCANEYEKDMKSYKRRFKNIEEVAKEALGGEDDKTSALIFIKWKSDLNVPENDCSMKG